MIYGRGKCLYRVLGLAAYNAARRFASRRLKAGGRRNAWRPMVLRWRLRRRLLGNVLGDRAAPQSNFSWFPQFHFHFASHISDRTRPNPMPGRSLAADPWQKRVVMDHRWTSVPTATAPLQLDHAKQPAPKIYERKGPRAKEHAPVMAAPRVSWPRNSAESKAHLPMTSAPRIWWPSNSGRSKEHAPVTPVPRVSWPPLANQLVAWPTLLQRRQPFERTPEVRSMHREGQTQFLQTRSQIWQYWHQVFSLHRPKFSDPVPPRASGSKALQFQYERPEELVWRRTLQTPLTPDDDKRVAELSESVSGTQGRSQPGHESAAGVAPLLERVAAMQITKLDPAVLDRLTDDVIRRVEKRARIERQRRGL